MKIELPAHQTRYIQDKIDAGSYSSISQLIQASLDYFMEREEHQRLILDGLDDLKQKKTVSADEVFKSLRDRFT